MPNNNAFASSVNELLSKLEDKPTVETGIELANQIVSLFGEVNTKSVEDVFESSLELPNAERYDSWFQPHPIFKSDRACFDLADAPLLQAKFYWLKKRSRQILAGGVHFTPNYEDEEFTHNERYKVGLDFFLSPNGKSLQVVLSNRGNLRIVELSGRLNNTQREIFEKWIGAGSLKTQEALHSTLWESFKLKSVNQKFYDGVSNSFTELLQHLKSIDKDEEEAKLFASRLLGRLLFCWFLRKKGIIDESVGYFNAQSTDATSYYKQSLERLFFLTLNSPIDERDELTKQHQKALFPELLVDDRPSLFKTDQKTPYLNGGLFEPHENDWYKDDSLTLPEGFFTNLYDHFEEFNFTTDESSPEYEQIAIDPEMLGRVFESLLATQVDETGQQARKAKGAFYTPREIVSYMCKESLRNYLYNAVNNDEGTKESIDSLLDITDSEWAKSKSNTLRDKVKDNRTQIIDALDAVTILDPACGSGAFPMGMLQLMLKTYERLESRFDPYKTKLSVIQNNIFGVDIEPMAVEISRLRAWLSLIVDEDDPRSVDPLPNLDFKFIAANTLIKPDRSFGLDESTQANSRSKMQTIIKKYFAETDKDQKQLLKTEFIKLESKISQISMFGASNAQKQIQSFKPFDNQRVAEFFDAKLMFGLSQESPFDIVIGNPPYIQLQKNSGILADLYKDEGYETFVRTGDIYSLFYERGLGLTKKKSGLLCFITSNKWMRAGYGEKTRFYFAKKDPILLIDFGGFKVFESATVDTNIILIGNKSFTNSFRAMHVKADFAQNTLLQDYFATNFQELRSLSSDPWVINSPSIQNLRLKIESTGEKIKYLPIDINFGIIPGYSKAYIIDEKTKDALLSKDSRNAEIIVPMARGRDIKPYSIDFKNNYLILVHNGIGSRPRIDVEREYPSIYEHLLQYKDKLLKRDKANQGSHWTNLRDCAYLENMMGEKIIYPDITRGPRFYYDYNGTYILNDSCFFMKLSDNNKGLSYKYLLALMHSKPVTMFFKKFYAGGGLGGDGYRYKKPFLNELPIPLPTKANAEKIRELENLAEEMLSAQPSDTAYVPRLDALVCELYDLNVDEVRLIDETEA